MSTKDCAVVLAGGVGSRLMPYTTVLPKPLMPVGDRPILEIVLRQLAAAGFERIILAVNHRDALLRAVLGDGSAFGVELIYSKESQPLGTIGPLHPVADQLGTSFLVMNGDLLTDLDYRAFLEAHRAGDAGLSVGVVPREQPIDYGVIEIGPDSRATGFREKPTLDLWVSMGVYAMDRNVLRLVPPGRPFGFDNLMLTLLERQVPVATRPHRGQWFDIGRPDDFEAATAAFLNHEDRFLPAPTPVAAAGAAG